MTYRDLIPPIAAQLWSAIRTRRVPTFATYDEALRAAGAGYADDELARVVLSKTLSTAGDLAGGADGPYTAATLLAVVVATGTGPVRVLDFGGAFGEAYFLCRSRLPSAFRWAVVESATFARHGAAVANNELRIFDSTEAAHSWLGGVDLVFSSGGLQYVRSPESTLSTLLDLDAPVVALFRSALSLGARVITLQWSRLSANGPGPLPPGVRDRVLSYPRTFAREVDMRSACEARGYRLVLDAAGAAERATIGGQPVVSGGNYIWLRDNADEWHRGPRPALRAQ